MDLGQQAQFVSLLKIDNVTLCEIDTKNQVTKLENSTLSLNEFQGGANMHMLQINQVQFVIYKQLAFYVSEYQTFRSYIFRHQEKNYSLNINLDQMNLIEIFEKSLSEISSLLYNSTHNIGNEDLQKKIDEERKSNNQVCGFIKSGGNMLSQGIKFGVNTTQQGIQTASTYLKSNKKQEEIKISEENKKKMKQTQGQTSEVIAFTHQATKALLDLQISMGKTAAQAIFKQKEKQDKPSKPLDPKLQYLKDIGDQSIATCGDVLNCMDDGAGAVGKAFGENTKDVIQHRYGEDAAQCADMAKQSAGNAFGAYKDVKGVGVKQVIKNQGKVTAQEVGKQI